MANLRPSENNKYRALWEFAHRRAAVDSIPSMLNIARSNTCNFKCVYCPDHRVGNNIARHELRGTTWDNLLALVPRIEWLAFHGISEFMIDRNFFDIVRRCGEAGSTLAINTNGSVCTPKHLEALTAYPGRLSMIFSLDAAGPEFFLRIRGWDFWRVIRNIRTYVESFENRRDRTWLGLSFVIMKSNVKEMLPFVFLAKALKVDGVKYYRLCDGNDWRISTEIGDTFDYRGESTDAFVDEYNQELERTRRAAEILGLSYLELPAPVLEKAKEQLQETAEPSCQEVSPDHHAGSMPG